MSDHIYPSDKNLRRATFALPFVVTIHNLEELFSMERWSRTVSLPFQSPVTTAQFGIAVALLTALGFLVVFIQRPYRSEERYFRIIVAFAGLLFLNVFFPHLIATLYFQSYTPGVISGLLLNLPLTTYILLRGISLKLVKTNAAIGISLVGGIIGAVLVVTSLRLGAFLASL